MAHTNWCGNCCADCNGCSLDERIPCSPDCNNLIGDMINVRGCVDAQCEEVFHIFGREDLLKKMGKTWDMEIGNTLVKEVGSIVENPAR